VFLTVVHPVAGVTEEFGDAGEVSSILELAVGVQQVEDLAFVRKHRDTSCLIARPGVAAQP
jgi:hypothetical protein